MTKRLRGRAAVEQRRRRLADEPLCRLCAERGVITPSTVPDHIKPLALGGLDIDTNIRCLCDRCHRMVTAEQFGKTRSKGMGGCDATGLPTDPTHPWAAARGRAGPRDPGAPRPDPGAATPWGGGRVKSLGRSCWKPTVPLLSSLIQDLLHDPAPAHRQRGGGGGDDGRSRARPVTAGASQDPERRPPVLGCRHRGEAEIGMDRFRPRRRGQPRPRHGRRGARRGLCGGWRRQRQREEAAGHDRRQ